MTDDTAAESAELARWWVGTRKGRMSPREYLATAPPADDVMPRLIRLLDRPGRGGALGRAFAAYLSADLDALFAEHHPRRAAKLAMECRARGDHPHAGKLHAALIALMFCANCGRPLNDPLSIDRGIGPDCWEVIDPEWRMQINGRLALPEGIVTTPRRVKVPGDLFHGQIPGRRGVPWPRSRQEGRLTRCHG